MLLPIVLEISFWPFLTKDTFNTYCVIIAGFMEHVKFRHNNNEGILYIPHAEY